MTAFKKPSLIAIAWPIFVEQALRMLIGTVDTFMVSHVSDGAVAALSVANQIIFLFIIIFNFIGIGASVVITHHLGAKDDAGAAEVSRNAIAVNTWLGAVVSVAVFFGAGALLKGMSLPENLMEYALPFLTLMGGSLVLEATGMSIAAVLRANKHTKDAMFVALGQNIINVVGNCILLFGLFGAPKLGVYGVAVSSVFSRICSVVALWILLDYRTHLRFRVADFFRIKFAQLGRILRIGLPAAGEHLCYWTAYMLVTRFIAGMGAESLAVQSYTGSIQRLVILFSISIGLGTEIIIGHLVGAGEFEEAYKELLRSVRTGFILATSGIAIVALTAPYSIGLFTSDAVVLSTCVLLLRMSIVLEPGRVFNIVVINSLRATGDVGFPIKMAVLSMWCVWVPGAYFLGVKLAWGLPGIWIAMTADEWIRGMLMYRRWKSRAWLPHAKKSHSAATGEAANATAYAQSDSPTSLTQS